MAGNNSTDINQLGQLDNPSSSDLLAVWSTNNARTRKISISQLYSLFQSSWTSPTYQTTINTPIEGFNLTMTADANNQWLILTPASGLNTGTLLLPQASTAADGQEVIINTTQQITALTLSENGATNIYGKVSTLAADSSAKYRFNKQLNSWFIEK